MGFLQENEISELVEKIMPKNSSCHLYAGVEGSEGSRHYFIQVSNGSFECDMELSMNYLQYKTKVNVETICFSADNKRLFGGKTAELWNGPMFKSRLKPVLKEGLYSCIKGKYR